MDLKLGGGRVPSTGAGGPILHAAVAVRLGRISLGRFGLSLAPSRPADVRLVAGLRSACWIGPPDARAPDLGRLCHHTTATIDARHRLNLDRHVRGYLGVSDPLDFDVVLVSPPTGGLLLVPVEDLEERLARVSIP